MVVNLKSDTPFVDRIQKINLNNDSDVNQKNRNLYEFRFLSWMSFLQNSIAIDKVFFPFCPNNSKGFISQISENVKFDTLFSKLIAGFRVFNINLNEELSQSLIQSVKKKNLCN